MIDVSNVCYYCGNQSIPNFRYNGVKVCPEHAPADEVEKSAKENIEDPWKDLDFTMKDYPLPPLPPLSYTDYSKTVSVKVKDCPSCNPNGKPTFMANQSCKICNGDGFTCE